MTAIPPADSVMDGQVPRRWALQERRVPAAPPSPPPTMGFQFLFLAEVLSPTLLISPHQLLRTYVHLLQHLYNSRLASPRSPRVGYYPETGSKINRNEN